MDKYFDSKGYISLGRGPEYNAILFTAEYYILKNIISPLGQVDKTKLKILCEDLYNKKYYDWRWYPESTDIHMSHDNMTGIVCAAKKFGFDDILDNIEEFDATFQRWHPRDIVFYGFCKHKGIVKFLYWLFMWIPALSMIVSCAQNYKYRNGRQILKTDGKILAWLRFNTIKMPVTKWICTKLIKFNDKFISWKNVFRMYFEDENHPINKLWKEL